MPFYDPTTRTSKELVPGLTIRPFWGENILVGVVHIEPHTVLPSHSHPHEQCSYYVLEAELEFILGTERRTMHAADADHQLGGLYQWMDPHYYGYDLSYVRIDETCAPLDADYQGLMQWYYEGLLHYLQGTAPAVTPQLDCTHEPRTNNESCRPPQTPSYVGCWRFLRPGPGYEWDNYEIYAGKLQRVVRSGTRSKRSCAAGGWTAPTS